MCSLDFSRSLCSLVVKAAAFCISANIFTLQNAHLHHHFLSVQHVAIVLIVFYPSVPFASVDDFLSVCNCGFCGFWRNVLLSSEIGHLSGVLLLKSVCICVRDLILPIAERYKQRKAFSNIALQCSFFQLLNLRYPVLTRNLILSGQRTKVGSLFQAPLTKQMAHDVLYWEFWQMCIKPYLKDWNCAAYNMG